jgi:NAD(P)-dependent dehydrogenase (short-subunit alcohol dehydrogenase family)
MIAKGSGSIVNITTMAAHIGMPGTSAYGATKAALSSLTRTWVVEFSVAGVRVNSLSPGPTRTDTVVAAMGNATAEQVGKATLLGRQASPREIAEVILFLASDRSTTSPAPPSPWMPAAQLSDPAPNEGPGSQLSANPPAACASREQKGIADVPSHYRIKDRHEP